MVATVVAAACSSLPNHDDDDDGDRTNERTSVVNIRIWVNRWQQQQQQRQQRLPSAIFMSDGRNVLG